jgi:transcriptional regulator NrdR family protein
MKCIYCQQRGTAVTNSRAIAHDTIIWRRRHCDSCGKTFTTRETSVGDNLFVIKRNGSRERFVYEKFFASIYAVIRTGKNSDSGDSAKMAKEITHTVLEQVFKENRGKEVRTSKIIELSYKELRKISRSFAFAYGTYSEYRSKRLTQMGFMV